MIEIYIKSTEAIYDDPTTPTKILGWNVVYTGQRMSDLKEYSKTGTITVDNPMPYSDPVDFGFLTSLIGTYADEQGWDQEILEELG